MTPELLDSFHRFVLADTVFSHFKSEALLALDDARDAWKKERRDRDSTADTSSVAFDRAAAGLETMLHAEVEQEFTANQEFIKEQIKAELLEETLGDDARTAYELQHDRQVAAAIRYLEDNRQYMKVFKKAKDKG